MDRQTTSGWNSLSSQSFYLFKHTFFIKNGPKQGKISRKSKWGNIFLFNTKKTFALSQEGNKYKSIS
jgi:hypothetical protein